MGGGFKKVLSKSPVQTIGMRLLQGDNIWRAVTQNAGTPAQRGLHQWINKQYKGLTSSGGDSGEPASGSQYDPMLMMYMSQMQAQQAQQAEAARKAQEDALMQAQQQSALSSAQQSESQAQQALGLHGAQQNLQDQAAEEERKKAEEASGVAAIGSGFDITKARQAQIANLATAGTVPGTLPFYGYDSANTGVGGTGRAANVFNLPKTTDIKFGGK